MIKATLIVDASRCSDSGASGWAAWIKTDVAEKSIVISGRTQTLTASSSEAEVFGIANALAIAMKRHMIPSETLLMIQCDSTHALTLVRAHVPGATVSQHADSARLDVFNPKTKISDNLKRGLAFITQCVNDHKLSVQVRHVRGHTAVTNGRSWVNAQCDMLARKAMRERRAEYYSDRRAG